MPRAYRPGSRTSRCSSVRPRRRPPRRPSLRSEPMPVRPNIRAMAGYMPGEQPRDGEYVKLNTNENPYPPSPRVFEAIRAALTGDRLRKYPEPLGDTFRHSTASVFGVSPDQILIGNGSHDISTTRPASLLPE